MELPLEAHLRKTVLAKDRVPTGGFVVLCAPGAEARTRVSESWGAAATVSKVDRYQATVNFDGKTTSFSLRDYDAIKGVIEALTDGRLLLDVTGMPTFLWAPLLRVAIDIRSEVTVAYVEPEDYRRNPNPLDSAELFDMNERIEGLGPLPGFAVLSHSRAEDEVFVALLGFEGVRPLGIASSLEEGPRETLPVVPVPGFRLEYPAYTYLSNRQFLEQSDAWGQIRYAAGDDPLDLCLVLREVAEQWSKRRVRIALTGTKPHAVGAVLFALANTGRVELLYDYPVTREDRAIGVRSTILIDLDGIVDELRQP